MGECVVEVALARTALKLGLSALGAQPGQVILVPNFCCDVVLHPIVELKLEVQTYKLNSDLTPDWDNLNEIDTRNVFGILMIHYFGQPQNVAKFYNYCREKNLKLIEDNAHGFGGSYAGKNLGTFGDIGISSPRKIFGTPQGGVLYLKSTSKQVNKDLFLTTTSFRLHIVNLAKLLISRHQQLYNYLIVRKILKYNLSDPYAFREKMQSHRRVNFIEKLIFRMAKTEKIAKMRRQLWKEWEKYLKKRGLRPVFAKLDENSCPWAIPFYCDNIEQRDAWINWGLVRNLPFFCWPSLPDDQIEKKDCAYEKWETIVCIPLNTSDHRLE